MKLLNLFLAVVAATETTVPGVETTAVATVAASTAADVVETTAAATVAENTVADVVETTPTATVAESTVADVVETTDSVTACDEARGAFEAAANESEKTALKTACDLACAGGEEQTCGFLVNGLSFVLFAILAVFKY